jgi:cytidyltransferase-like protein
LQYIEAAKAQCDHLIAIVNNDHQVELKGSRKFMDEEHRCSILKALRAVDHVLLSIDEDRTVCQSIALLRTGLMDDDLYFFNSGDRQGVNAESKEVILCKELGIKYVAISLPKLYASSKLLEKL